MTAGRTVAYSVSLPAKITVAWTINSHPFCATRSQCRIRGIFCRRAAFTSVATVKVGEERQGRYDAETGRQERAHYWRIDGDRSGNSRPLRARRRQCGDQLPE